MQHKCFKCGTEYDGNFCPECGERWQENKTCPNCGATLAGNAKFCNECGYSFAQSRSPAAPQRTRPAPAPISAPIPPKEMEKPQKPQKPIYRDTVPLDKREELMPEMEQNIKRKRTIAALCLLLPSLFLSIFLLIWSRKAKVKGWHPEKIYQRGGLLYCIVITIYTILAACFGLVVIIPEIDAAHAMVYVFALSTYLIGFIIIIILVVLMIKTIKQRKKLVVALCGYDSPEKNPELKEQYDKEWKELGEKVAEYKRQKAIYRENQRRWQVYRYQMSRYSKGKPYETVPHVFVWCSIHKAALSVTAVALAAVITITCVFTLRDTRFRVENLVEIGLGADEKKVTDVLGEPFLKETKWYYYSKNFVSVKEEMDDLEERSMNVDSMEELDKLFEESEKLEEKLKTLEYQAIVVNFSVDNTVWEMTLDMAAVYETRSKKEVKTCEIEPKSYQRGSDTKVSYSITYTDGSYATGYCGQSQLPTKTGEQTIQWSNEWGSYTATITVTGN